MRGLYAALAAVGVSLFAATPAQAADYTIYDGAKTSPVLVDPSYGGAHDDRDYRQIRRAVQDLRQDVAMVTGAIDPAAVQGLFVDDEAAQRARLNGADQSKVPALLTAAGDAKTAIIVGEIGESALVDGIIAAGRFDEAEALEGRWEAHAIKRIDDPLPGLDSALVIAGSDARGTIYGVYELSELIGVSPFYWYSDVPVERRDTLTVDGAARVDDGPDVKYRGIFINDEERTIDWAKLKFPTDKGTPDVNYYRHVYELMLRLKLNTIWPAMHEGTTSFNAATDTGLYDTGTPINAEEAAAYGVIASSSHAELMLRSNVEEWRPFYERNREALNIQGANYTAAFNYSINKPAIIQYWRERLVANREFESILALGMRGVHDGAPAFTANNPYGFANRVEMVGDAITEQRKLVEEIYGAVDAVPQVFVPYKEMADLYNDGLKAYIPGDVTLVWAEDNYGYLRQVPTRSEAARPGGNGIYYHASYWGDPESYLWLNSAPMGLMVEQLRRAWNTGAGRFWILNVGDLKPGEMKTERFAELAWDVEGFEDERSKRAQLARDFGLSGQDADTVAAALARFAALENAKRAEFWGTQNPSSVTSPAFNGSRSYPFSPTSDGDELQRTINEANALVTILEDVAADFDAPTRAAFVQQVLHRVSSYRNHAEQIGYFWKFQLAVEQGRYGSAKAYAQVSKLARERIKTEEAAFHALNGGKWDKAIGYDHPVSYYNNNQGIVMLTDDRYTAAVTPVDGVGAGAEGTRTPGGGTLRFDAAAPDDERFFDVFDRNDVEEEWVAEADAPWIELSATAGRTSSEQRVVVTVDWTRVSASTSGTIRVYNAADGQKTGEPVASFTVQATRSDVNTAATPGHVEANGYVAVEAEHFAESLPGADGSRWEVAENVAQRGDTMKAVPETAPRVDADFAGTARLKYRVYFTSTGQFTGTFYRVPTLNEGAEDDGTTRSARTAIGLDGAVPTTAALRGCAQTSCGSAWANNVMRQIEPLTFTIDVTTPGWHDLVVYRSDASIVFDRIVIPTVTGAAGDGLVGPVESPNSIAPARAATVAALPKAVTASRALPAVTLERGETRAVAGVEDAASVSSDNPTAVTAALAGGEVKLTGHRVGVAEVTVGGGDGALASFTVTVQRPDAAPLGAYQERDGRVVIDAADALENSDAARAVASNNGTHGWALARNGLQASPPAITTAQNWLATSAAQGQALLGAGATQKVNGSAAAGTPPRLEFTVDIENAGTYYLFANTSNPNAIADSYHVAVDGAWRYHSSKGGEELGTETWYGSTSVNGAALSLSAGTHTIAVWAREAGLLVNQLALSTSTSPGFSGFQAPSPRAGADSEPPATAHTLAPAEPNGQNGWYTAAPTLTLATEAGATTEYRIGAAAYQPYSAPVALDGAGTVTVTYRSTDAAGNVEAEKSVSVKVDTAAPTTTATASEPPGADGWYAAAPTLTLAGADGESGIARTEFAIDGGEWQAYTAPLVAPAGEHVIRFRSTDHAGLVETAQELVVKVRGTGSDVPVDVAGDVPGVLALTVAAPGSLGLFAPGVTKDYSVQTTARVTSSAADATLTVVDPSPTHTGRLVNGPFALSRPLHLNGSPIAAAPLALKTWAGPVTRATVPLVFTQSISEGEALRRGVYSKTLTFTLSTTTP